MASEKVDWKNLTPDSLIGAVTHIRGRFEEEDFKFGFVTQQMCYKELHPVAPTKIASAVFKQYMDEYERGLKQTTAKQFPDLLEIGLANPHLLSQDAVEWAQTHLEILITDKQLRVEQWIKNVCDQQEMSESTTPEEMEEFIYWRTWRAPKLIHMQPSGNTPYDPATAWSRESEEQTEKVLHGLSKRLVQSLVFNLERVAGEAHVQLAKRGRQIYRPSAQESSAKNERTEGPDPNNRSPVVFISYSWDSDAHKEWVYNLATRLREQGGVQIILDRWHLPPGGDKTVFMEKSVVNSTFVILICTPHYAQKANNRRGGVGYEAMVITGELAKNIHQRKFIPVVRDGDWESSLPVWINTKFGIDLKGDPYSEREYEVLLRALHNEPLTPPAIGPKPDFKRKASSPVEGSKATAKQTPVRFFNFDGTPGPISVSGRQHSELDSSQVDLWGLVTIANYTHSPMRITPIKLFLSGAEWPVKKIFFREKSSTRAKFERISLVGNQKEHYELHFMFSVATCPQAKSGHLLVESDSGEAPYPVDVKFP